MKLSRPLVHWPIELWPEDALPRWPTRFTRLLSDLDDEIAAVSDWKPAIDVKETESEYEVTVDIPGVDSKDIVVSMDRGVLTISGNRAQEERDEKNSYKRVERFEGTFLRRMHLHDAADDAEIKATAKEGVLTVRVPKMTKARSRRIEVTAA